MNQLLRKNDGNMRFEENFRGYKWWSFGSKREDAKVLRYLLKRIFFYLVGASDHDVANHLMPLVIASSLESSMYPFYALKCK